MESRQASQMTTGIMVIVVGLLLLGHELRLGLDFGRLWPVLLVIAGISRFASTDDQGRRGNGGWMVLIGVLFLLNNYHLVGLGDSWPLWIIFAGFGIMFGRGKESRRRRDAEAASGTVPTPGDRPWDGRPQA